MDIVRVAAHTDRTGIAVDTDIVALPPGMPQQMAGVAGSPADMAAAGVAGMVADRSDCSGMTRCPKSLHWIEAAIQKC